MQHGDREEVPWGHRRPLGGAGGGAGGQRLSGSTRFGARARGFHIQHTSFRGHSFRIALGHRRGHGGAWSRRRHVCLGLTGGASHAGGTRCGRWAQPRPHLVGDVAPRGPRGRRVPSRRRGPGTAVASCLLATARALGDRMEHRRRRLREARERSSFSRSPRGVLPRHWSLSSSASPPTWDRAPRREMKGDACLQLPARGGDPVPVRHHQV